MSTVLSMPDVLIESRDDHWLYVLDRDEGPLTIRVVKWSDRAPDWPAVPLQILAVRNDLAREQLIALGPPVVDGSKITALVLARDPELDALLLVGITDEEYKLATRCGGGPLIEALRREDRSLATDHERRSFTADPAFVARVRHFGGIAPDVPTTPGSQSEESPEALPRQVSPEVMARVELQRLLLEEEHTAAIAWLDAHPDLAAEKRRLHGKLVLKCGDPERAADILEVALREDPHPETQRTLALAYGALERTDLAVAMLDRLERDGRATLADRSLRHDLAPQRTLYQKTRFVVLGTLVVFGAYFLLTYMYGLIRLLLWTWS